MTTPMPVQPTDPDADTPLWWLNRLVHELLTRQPHLDLRERYVDGRHNLPRGDRRYMRALVNLQTLATTNYIGLVTSAPVERMHVRGFRFGPAGTADSDAAQIWASNDMDLQASLIHSRAAKYGLAYALVSPPDDPDDKWPVITAEDPRCTVVYKDPVRPTRSLAALRMWADDRVGHILAMLYLPDTIYAYVGPVVTDMKGWTLQTIRQRLTGMTAGVNAFTLVDSVANPFEEVPVVEYVWRPESGLIPEGEAGHDIRTIQDRINQTIFDRIVIGHFQAYKQRYATGITIPKGKKGQQRPPFDPGADMLWLTENTDAKFGEFTSADIGQILEAVRDDIADIAALTKTPAHYLMGKMANVSGETLTQAESGLVSKTEQRMQSMGWAHERVMKLCFAYLEDARAEDVDAETLWADPQKQITAELALAGQQWTAIGIPLPIVMERQGFTPDQIEFSVAEKAKADKATADAATAALEAQKAIAATTNQPPDGGAANQPPQMTKSGGHGSPATKPEGSNQKGT